MKWTVSAFTLKVHFSLLSFVFNQFGRLELLMAGKLQKTFLPFKWRFIILHFTYSCWQSHRLQNGIWVTAATTAVTAAVKPTDKSTFQLANFVVLMFFPCFFFFNGKLFLYFASRLKKMRKVGSHLSSVDCPLAGCTVAFFLFFLGSICRYQWCAL